MTRGCGKTMLGLLLAMSASGAMAQEARVLDDFSDPGAWKLVVSNQVTGSLRPVAVAGGGKGLCLDYNFNGVSGYVGIRRALPVQYPQNYQFSLSLRGDSPANDLQFKLIDASGDNVWWVNRPGFAFPRNWTTFNYRKRHVDKAWGPGADKVLRSSAAVEFTVYNKVGGRGTVCFDRLTLAELPPEDASPYKPAVIADTATALEQRVADGREDTFWVSGNVKQQTVTLDLGRVREFGGARVDWVPGLQASAYQVRSSVDGRSWKDLREVVSGAGGTDWLALPDAEGRYLRFDLRDGPSFRYGIKEIQVQPLAFAATPNDFIKSLAAQFPKGSFPRGFSGEQAYWTILGLDGGTEQGLIGEDGAVEVAKAGFSIEPFIASGGKLLHWSDVASTQTLQDGYLPIPSVEWKHAEAGLKVTAFVQGQPGDAQLVTRYLLRNTDKVAHDYTLALAVRPFQVNPPAQFLNTPGGVSPINQLAIDGPQVSVNGKARLFATQAPDQAFATPFDAGMEFTHLLDKALPDTRQVKDATGLASGALLYRWTLQPGESREVAVLVPQTGPARMPDGFDAARAQQQVAQMWRDKLDRVRFSVPGEGKPLVDTLRTALAHMLISRIGPRLQPGTRSYSRSWIRDGAMISEGLLRMGREDAVREYVDWFAPYQFANGMVPCCVDDRGSDPVPENDSHGELIFNIAEYYRYTGDRAFLERMWPHVSGAYGYMEQLRLSERTEANFMVNPAFYGMMPVSISHEGYSAKPVHSYWDDFWALRGYKDAVLIADALALPDDAQRFAASRDQFQDDLSASLLASVRQHGIDYLPGSAELGDFDATSTTIALAPGGEQARLPQELLSTTFERYWTQFVERRDGKREWKDYTPYEWRNVAAFVRLGWRERAWDAVDFFFGDRTPAAWNQWAEVVSHTPRTPFFVGDLPHAWVASDFVRSVLDMFAYNRESDDSLVLAAGVPARWFEGQGIAIGDLRTPQGRLNYAVKRNDKQLLLQVQTGLVLPAGGIVFPWPYAGEPGNATVNGQDVPWQGNELHIQQLPAEVVIDVPASVRRAQRRAQ